MPFSTPANIIMVKVNKTCRPPGSHPRYVWVLIWFTFLTHDSTASSVD